MNPFKEVLGNKTAKIGNRHKKLENSILCCGKETKKQNIATIKAIICNFSCGKLGLIILALSKGDVAISEVKARLKE